MIWGLGEIEDGGGEGRGRRLYVVLGLLEVIDYDVEALEAGEAVGVIGGAELIINWM